MKLGVDVNEITLSGTSAVGEFKIRNSAKAFKILSDGLYSNKIRAIIRELSCNAVDSHTAAGRQDVPFEVHLPTTLEPWFSVRDFGTGLDDNQVMNIYTTYFESTKTESNDFIGALGLGSKSPFSYTENFTVTAIKDGVQRIYSAFINEHGVPSVVAMGTSDTDEQNGVEVKFSVTERHDYHSFQYESRNVFKWFKLRPIITGVDSFEIGDITYIEKDIVPGVHYGSINGSFAVMGNIAYPLHNVPEPSKHFGSLSDLLNCNLVIEFGIGELDFAASREELSYVPLTISSIKRKLEELNASLSKFLARQVEEVDTEWGKSQFLYKKRKERLFSSAVQKYVADTKFPLYSDKMYSNFTIRITEVELAAMNLTLSGFNTVSYDSTTRNFGLSRTYVNNDYINVLDIPVDNAVQIVFNDLKIGCVSRAKYHFGKQSNAQTVICISHSNPDPTQRQVDYDKLIAHLHNPPNIFKASELEKKPVKEKVSTSGIVYLHKRSNNSYYNTDDVYVWHNLLEEIDANKTYYYVPMSGGVVIGDDGKPSEIDIKALAKDMQRCGVPELAAIKIHGVRKSRIEEIKELDNWVPLVPHLKKVMANVDQKRVSSVIARNIVDTYKYRSYTQVDVKKQLPKDSPYRVFVETYASASESSDVTSLARMARDYGNPVDVNAVTNKVHKAAEDIIARYPMISIVSYTDSAIIADYVKLIDKQEKTND